MFCVQQPKRLFGFRAHPHKLVGTDCKDGYCKKKVSPGNTTVIFDKIGIQCVKTSGSLESVKDSLRLRQRNNIDPYRSMFIHLFPS